MISYKNLWKQLIDKDYKKTDLIWLADISSATLAKMGRGEPVSFETIEKLCRALKCGITDIVTIEPDKILEPEETFIAMETSDLPQTAISSDKKKELVLA